MPRESAAARRDSPEASLAREGALRLPRFARSPGLMDAVAAPSLQLRGSAGLSPASPHESH